jgi:transcriptional regulator with XRE-family HTH domain
MYNPELIPAAVARNLVALRAQRGLSLDQLARQAGVSKGMLVQIEQARTNPSIATLCRIANALGISIARLVEAAEAPPVRVTRWDDAPVLWRGRGASAAKLLFGAEGPEIVEFWEWTIAPGDAHDGVAHPPGAYEILFCLEGTLTLEVGGRADAIKPRDTLMFRADRPHRYANRGKRSCRFAMVVVEPPPAVSALAAAAPSRTRARTARSRSP